MSDAIVTYVLGLCSGSLLAWFIMQMRLADYGAIDAIGQMACTQAAAISAISDVCDDGTLREIEQRANDRLEECSLPGEPRFQFDGGDDGE